MQFLYKKHQNILMSGLMWWVLNLGCTSESFGELKNIEMFGAQPESIGLSWGWGATRASRYFLKIISAVAENHWSGLIHHIVFCISHILCA